jgi:hypothetical protein
VSLPQGIGWPAAGERYVRNILYGAGFRYRGLEFQVTMKPGDPFGAPYFQLVLGVPCDCAGHGDGDHWPCDAGCGEYQTPVHAWYDIPPLGDGMLAAMDIIAADALARCRACTENFSQVASRWDELHEGAP